MRKCKNKRCENIIEKPSKKIFCSERCRKQNYRIPKVKSCARTSCLNTFEVNASRQKFCSVECRKVGVEKSQEKMYIASLQNKFDHDYNYVFSNRFQDWIYSPQRVRENRRREKKKIIQK